jgi:very-short-patch-repair endonuclease
MLNMSATATQSASRPVDDRIARLAAEQYGVVSRPQLREIGLSNGAITARVARGVLHPRHHGVYSVGHAVLGSHGRWMAAVLACGPSAVLSHAAAAALWELRSSAATTVDVTVPGAGGRQKRKGIRVHRARSLESTNKDGSPVTTPRRTILDLAATLDRRGIERLLDRAELQRLGDTLSLDALARAHAGHRGAHKLLRTLHHHNPGTTLTKSELEERFYALRERAGLAKPAKVNDHVEALEADFIFKNQRVLVETDSWQHHKSRESFEQDRRRDAIHAAAHWRTLRFTYRQIEDDPATVAAAVEAALRYRGASAASSDA